MSKTYSDYGIIITGNKNSGETTALCPKCSHTRKPEHQKIKCLGVNLDKRCFRCNHCGWEGGLPPISGTVNYNNTPKTYTKPVWKNNTELSERLVKWFETERKISQNTLIKLKITEDKVYMPQAKAERNCIQFNYFREGDLVNIKSRDGKKNFKLESGAELILYNIDSLIGAKEVYITEGEIEVATLVECGIIREGVGGVSVPNGANAKSNNLSYLDSAIDLFDTVEKIYLATDDDVPGRKLREDLADRFGKDKCYYITYNGKKDLNEVLVASDIQGVIDCCGSKKEFPLEGIFQISDFSDEINDMYVNGLDRGLKVGLGKFDNHLRLVKGWFTVVGGIPGSGKTQFLEQMLTKMMVNHNWKVGYYSPENKPTKLHFSKMARLLTGKSWFGPNKITRGEIEQCKSFLEDKVYFVEPENNFTLASILDSFKLLKKRKGIDCMVIDAWNRLEHKSDGKNETKYVNESLLKLDAFCKLYNMVCFLVAHPVKMDKDKKTGKYLVPTLYNISGSSHFFNITGNGLTVYRDYEKEITEVHVQKVKFQPEWGEPGLVTFKYDKESGRYNEYNFDPGFVYKEDKSSWLPDTQAQTTMSIPAEKQYDGGIVTDGEEPPF